jgi:hypothetical protein
MFKRMLLVSLLAVVTGCSSGSSSSSPSPSPSPQLVAISVQTANMSVPLGGGYRFSATGIYSDNSSDDLTTAVTWSSADTSVAIISNDEGSKGTATSVAGGTTTITATSVGVSGSTGLRVVPIGGTFQGTPLVLKRDVTKFPSNTAQFKIPMGITTDGIYLYVTDSDNNQLKKIEISTGAISIMVCTDQWTGTAVSFNHPDSITTDGTYLYVVESQNNNLDGNVRKIDKVTGVSTTFASSVVLSSPAGITTDGINLYVTDAVNNSIHRIVISTGDISTLAGSASDPPGSNNGTGLDARFSSPVGITTDGINLFVADFGNHTIRQIVIASRVVTTLAGSPGQDGAFDKVGTAARFRYPRGISTDGTNLYVTDYFNHMIRSVVISTSAVSTLAGSGQSGSTDGNGDAALFWFPEGITSDGKSLFIADSYNNTIRKMN